MGEPLGAREPLIARSPVVLLAHLISGVATRPPGFRCCLWLRLISGRRGARPPARRPRCVLLLVVPLVFRAPSGPAAREIATRESAARSGRSRSPPWPCRRPRAPQPGPAPRSPPVPSGPSGALHTGVAVSLCVSGCVVSKPAQALPPPTGTAARLCGSSGALHTGVAVSLCVSGCVVSKPGQARPPPTSNAARLCGPSGALYTGGTCVAWTSPVRPCCQFHFTPGRALSLLSPHSMSHAIPSQLFQTMNLDCWNCTVFRYC